MKVTFRTTHCTNIFKFSNLQIFKLKSYKLISRILFLHYHLSVPQITLRNQSAYPPASGEQPSGAGIRGISACKVYPLYALLHTAVGSYPTFSPFSRVSRIVIFCGTFCCSDCSKHPAVHRCICSVLSRLSLPQSGTIVRFVARAKLRNNGERTQIFMIVMIFLLTYASDIS